MSDHRSLPEQIRDRAGVEALLASATNYEERLPRDPLRKALDLGRTRALLQSLEDPQQGPITVQVAGSKGKGTTARMIASGLRHARHGPVGLYTSPHLEDLSERIEIDGAPASDAALAAGAQAVLAHVREHFGTPRAPTFFEIFTAIAWHAFRDAGCSHVVLETGLGGRLDATTVCAPAVTVITPIELEHTRQLGSTVAAIATEKAGILKPGIPAVLTATGEAAGVIERRASALGAPIFALGKAFGVHDALTGPGRTLAFRFDMPAADGPTRRRETARLPLAGIQHAENAAAARMALELLGVDAARAWEGIAGTRLPGLLEEVAAGPLVLIDGAHTPRSAQATREAVAACWPDLPVVLLLALLEEKDAAGVASKLGANVRAVVTTQVASPRAVPARTLAERAREVVRAPVEFHAQPAIALARARQRAGNEGLVLAAGSVYLAGEIRGLARTPSR